MKAKLFAALALVVMTGVFNPVGVPHAMAQAVEQLANQAAVDAINAAQQAGRITSQAAETLIRSVTTQGATVAAQNGVLVVSGGNVAAAAALGTTGFTVANVAVVSLVVAGVAVAVSSDGTTATTGTTGTQ